VRDGAIVEDEVFYRSPTGYGAIPWDEAMKLPGSRQVGLGKKLLETLPWPKFPPSFPDSFSYLKVAALGPFHFKFYFKSTDAESFNPPTGINRKCVATTRPKTAPIMTRPIPIFT